MALAKRQATVLVRLLFVLIYSTTFPQGGYPLDISTTVRALNPRSLRVAWTLISTTLESEIANFTVSTTHSACGNGSCYEEIVNAPDREFTFTGLVPFSYEPSQDGVGWSTTVVANPLPGFQQRTSNTVETILPECYGTCNFRYYTGNATCSGCVCNPAFMGPNCDTATFFPTNVQATEEFRNGSYFLRVSWDQPNPLLLDGRLIFIYDVDVLTPDNAVAVSMMTDLTSAILNSTDLLRSTSYSAVVSTIADTADEAASSPIEIETLSGLPGPVQNLNATTISKTKIRVFWSPPTITSPITGYTLAYEVGAVGTETVLLFDASVMEAEIAGLTPGTEYRVTVFAENELGSGTALTITIQTDPNSCPMDSYGAPTDVNCTPCPMNSGSLEGTVNITGCVCLPGYSGNNGGPCDDCPPGTYKRLSGDRNCVSCPTLLTTTSTASTSIDDCNTCQFSSGQLSATNLCYAFDTTTTLDGPNEENITNSSIELSWAPQTTAFTVSGDVFGSVVGYRITCQALRGLILGGYSHNVTFTVDHPITSYTVMQLAPLVEYGFTIAVVAQFGNTMVEETGPPSLQESIITEASADGESTLPYIRNVTSVDAEDGSVRVYYTVHPNLVSLITSFILRYELPPPAVGSFEDLRGNPTTESDFTVDGIEASFIYRFQLITEIGSSTYRSEIYFYNSSSDSTATPPPPLLDPPAAVSATSLGSSSIMVSWTKVDGAVGYKVRVASTEDASSFETTVAGGSVLSTEVTGLNAFTKYAVSVAGVTDDGVVGSESNVSLAMTDPDDPSPPTNVRVTEISSSLINVTWSTPYHPNGNITGYNVVITVGGVEEIHALGNQLSVVLPKPSGGQAYTVSVIAINHVGMSEPQEAETATGTTEEPTTDSNTSTLVIAGSAAGGFAAVVLLGFCCGLCLCVCCYRKSKRGKASLKKDNTYLLPVTSKSETLADDILMDSLNQTRNRYTLTGGSFVAGNPGAADMYAEVDDMRRMRESFPTESFRQTENFRQMDKSATPDDYDDEELYQSIAEKLYCVDVDKVNSLTPFELERSKVTVKEHKVLGEGEFGRVVKGVAKGVIPAQPESDVAIKMLKEGASESSRKDFLGEAHMLAQFKHPNVMGLLGVVTASQPILVIIQFMPNGSLKSYLKTQKKRMSHGGAEDFGLANQLEIAEQIASGMEYLASKYFIHRDLAARNVLVGENNQVKISDFGLSRALAKDDNYYTLSAAQKLPVKWMALESIQYRKFSTYGDMWSFGVVLWEIFSYGAQPYKGVGPAQVLTYLQDGNRLSCPEACRQDVYEVMMQCWSEEKKKRPTFSQMKMKLKAIRIVSRKKRTNLDALATTKAASTEDTDYYINDDMGPAT